MSPWHGHLRIRYHRDGARTAAHDLHHGPLRVLQRLYPEGDAICHHVLVHPPGGLVGGDVLDVDLQLAAGSHAVLTTPGATRFYRSTGEPAVQSVVADVADEARLEWLPLETIAYSGCIARNRLAVTLAPGASMIGWDLLALGLPAAGLGWERGEFRQDLSVVGTWLEQARIRAGDRSLLDGPVGLAGRRLVATLWWAEGRPIPAVRRLSLVEAAQDAIASKADDDVQAGCTAPDDRIVIVRALAHRVEPAMALLRAVRLRWRVEGWGVGAVEPRVWAT